MQKYAFGQNRVERTETGLEFGTHPVPSGMGNKLKLQPELI